MDDATPLSFASSSSSQKFKESKETNPNHWNLKFKRFSLKNVPSALTSDLIVEIVEMPKFTPQKINLNRFWKDLANDILSPFAPKNHSLLRFLNKSGSKYNTPRLRFSGVSQNTSPKNSIKKPARLLAKFSSPTDLPKPKSLSAKRPKKYIGPNKSFELEKFIDNQAEGFALSPRRKRLFYMRRRSCHCSECGDITKFQQKNMLRPSVIRYHQFSSQREEKEKKNFTLCVRQTPKTKRNSFMKALPKKTIITCSPDRSFTNLPQVTSSKNLPNSLTSFESSSNFHNHTKRSLINPPTLSGTLQSEKRDDLNKPQGSKERNSTMGFFYHEKCQTVTRNLTSREDDTHPEERMFSDYQVEKPEKRHSAELEKRRNLHLLLRNKEMKKKEHELYKLLLARFETTDQKFLLSISNMKINYSDAVSSMSEYFPNRRAGCETSRPNTSANQKLGPTTPKLNMRRKVASSPYWIIKQEGGKPDSIGGYSEPKQQGSNAKSEKKRQKTANSISTTMKTY